MAEEFLLTTANNLEGYVVVKQYGLVFGETVFKNSALDQLGAGISNIIDSLRFKATEMAGQMDLIETARDYAYNKLIEAAKRKGKHLGRPEIREPEGFPETYRRWKSGEIPSRAAPHNPRG